MPQTLHLSGEISCLYNTPDGYQVLGRPSEELKAAAGNGFFVRLFPSGGGSALLVRRAAGHHRDVQSNLEYRWTDTRVPFAYLPSLKEELGNLGASEAAASPIEFELHPTGFKISSPALTANLICGLTDGCVCMAEDAEEGELLSALSAIPLPEEGFTLGIPMPGGNLKPAMVCLIDRENPSAAPAARTMTIRKRTISEDCTQEQKELARMIARTAGEAPEVCMLAGEKRLVRIYVLADALSKARPIPQRTEEDAALLQEILDVCDAGTKDRWLAQYALSSAGFSPQSKSGHEKEKPRKKTGRRLSEGPKKVRHRRSVLPYFLLSAAETVLLAVSIPAAGLLPVGVCVGIHSLLLACLFGVLFAVLFSLKDGEPDPKQSAPPAEQP